MHFSLALPLAALFAASVSAAPAALEPRGVNPAQVPAYGVQAGVNPHNGICTGFHGTLIPCKCPPSRSEFLAKLDSAVASGHSEGDPVQWSSGNSAEDAQIRKQACIVVLQNVFGGEGLGCPAASTDWV